MPAPVTRRKALIGPGERIELILDFSGTWPASGSSSTPAPQGQQRARLPHVQRLADGVPRRRRRRGHDQRPGELRPLPDWGTARRSVDAQLDSSRSAGPTPTWLDQRQDFDPARVRGPELGTVETWELHNRTATAHMIHMHSPTGTCSSRNGRSRRAYERALKETFLLDPGERVRVAGALLRLPRQVRDPLPHARPRGPRPHVAVRDRRA